MRGVYTTTVVPIGMNGVGEAAGNRCLWLARIALRLRFSRDRSRLDLMRAERIRPLARLA